MGGRGRKCLPEHLRDKRHDDWLWPFSYIPRAWNAFCGKGPGRWGKTVCDFEKIIDINMEFLTTFKPIPRPGDSVWIWRDVDGSWRPYYARTWRLKNFWNGRYLHFRIGFRWDDVDFYYNLVLFNLSWEDR